MSTPFAANEHQNPGTSVAPKDAASGSGVDVKASSGLPSGKSFKLVKSDTSNNLYVETKEYDPLEHHRTRNKDANKGEGLGFMFCCCKPEVKEPAHTSERHYSLPQSNSMANMLPDKGL